MALGGVRDQASGWSVDDGDRDRHLRRGAGRRRLGDRRLRVRRAGPLRHRRAAGDARYRAARLDHLHPARGGPAMKTLPRRTCRRISTAAPPRSHGAGASPAPTARSSASPTTTGRSPSPEPTSSPNPASPPRKSARARAVGRCPGRGRRAALGPHHRGRYPRRPLGQCRDRGLAGELGGAGAAGADAPRQHRPDQARPRLLRRRGPLARALPQPDRRADLPVLLRRRAGRRPLRRRSGGADLQ